MPKRVLDVDFSGDAAVIHLRLLPGHKARYSALSYCWGPQDPTHFTTTRASVQSLMQGFTFSDLPKTLQDAVLVTRALRMRYLWVDALCIIQDDATDWATTLAGMAEIYDNATVTIAASCSPDSRAGFLKARPFNGPCLRVPFCSPFMTKEGLLWIQRYNGKSVKQRLSAHWSQPLQQRAWALQERFLSRRMVFFDDFELLWECHESRYREGTKLFQEVMELGGPETVRIPCLGRDYGHADTRFQYAAPARRSLMWTRSPRTPIALFTVPEQETRARWYQVLADYSIKGLTYASDALPALSGVAKMFAKDLRDYYMAGIWRQDIHHGLLWTVKTERQNINRSDPKFSADLAGLTELEQETASSGPSWSWASQFGDPDAMNLSVRSFDHMLSDRHTVQLLNSELIPLFDDIFAKLRVGRITLHGFSQQVIVRPSTDQSAWPCSLKFELEKTRDVTLDGSIDDYQGLLAVSKNGSSAIRDTTLSFLGLLISKFETIERDRMAFPRFYGLLLSKAQSERGAYKRSGLFFVDPSPSNRFVGEYEDDYVASHQ